MGEKQNEVLQFHRVKFAWAFLLLASFTPLNAQSTWISTGSLITKRTDHSATLLHNGKVLVAGGSDGSASLSSAELYDPSTGVWSQTGSLITARATHIAVRLPNGKVLVAGGSSDNPFRSLTSAELYDPNTGIWSATGDLSVGRQAPLAVLLQNGKVLVAAGNPTCRDRKLERRVVRPGCGIVEFRGHAERPAFPFRDYIAGRRKGADRGRKRDKHRGTLRPYHQLDFHRTTP